MGWLLFLGMLMGTTGCAVYMPLQGAAPDLHDQHQAEVRASTYLSRWDASAAYSPVRHVLVRGAFGRRSDSTDSTYWRGRQYELAAGTYGSLGDKWLVGGLGGYGRGRSEARFRNDGQLIFLGQPVQHQFNARFHKVFGEAYVLFAASPKTSWGLAARYAQLRFSTLTDVGTPVALRRMNRVEPTLLFRVRLGGSPEAPPPFQLQWAAGYSVSPGYDERTPDPDASRRQLRRGRGYVTMGVGILPHHLVKAAKGQR
ncbi:MAG: hypothetical protein H7Z21_10765 [Hymenobacter sp.]|nr:hypothetical protein [Hymenobacter sp.]